jgi:hypothetical protein
VDATASPSLHFSHHCWIERVREGVVLAVWDEQERSWRGLR